MNLRGELWHDGYLETKKSERNLKMLSAEIAREPQNAYLHFQLALEFTSLGQPQNAFASLQKARATCSRPTRLRRMSSWIFSTPRWR